MSNEVGYRGYINSVADELTAAPSETLPDSPLMYEDESGREENIKRFVREDRAVEAVIYPYPVHYDKEGEWADIDNRLVAEQRADGTSVYTNQAAHFNVYFADNISSDELVRVEKDGYVMQRSSLRFWRAKHIRYPHTLREATALALPYHTARQP